MDEEKKTHTLNWKTTKGATNISKQSIVGVQCTNFGDILYFLDCYNHINISKTIYFIFNFKLFPGVSHKPKVQFK